MKKEYIQPLVQEHTATLHTYICRTSRKVGDIDVDIDDGDDEEEGRAKRNTWTAWEDEL